MENSGVYKLGYKDATAPKTSINYRAKFNIPVHFGLSVHGKQS